MLPPCLLEQASSHCGAGFQPARLSRPFTIVVRASSLHVPESVIVQDSRLHPDHCGINILMQAFGLYKVFHTVNSVGARDSCRLEARTTMVIRMTCRLEARTTRLNFDLFPAMGTHDSVFAQALQFVHECGTEDSGW